MAEADEKTITAPPSRSAISDPCRRAIEKTLPDIFVDLEPAVKADFWNKLEQIKRAETPPEKLAAQCEEEVRRLDKLALLIPGGDAAAMKRMNQLGDVLRKRAATLRQIGKAGGLRFLRGCRLLWLWETVGGKLGVSTPRKRNHERLKEGEKSRSPHAPVIDYFQAVAEYVFGEPPGPEQIKKVAARYRRDFSPAIRAELNAGLLRAAFDIPFDADQQIRVSLDDSKIFILRDGKHIDKDGNVVDSVG
jgi:hypothetical protein